MHPPGRQKPLADGPSESVAQQAAIRDKSEAGFHI